MSWKIATFSVVLAGLLIGINPTNAQKGPCPPGTCAQGGGKTAADVKSCAKSNCAQATKPECVPAGQMRNRDRTRTGMPVCPQ